MLCCILCVFCETALCLMLCFRPHLFFRAEISRLTFSCHETADLWTRDINSWQTLLAQILTLISTTSAASMATSVPVPMAMPTSAMARAGESLTPSPTMATTFPACCSCSTLATLWEGSTSANTFLIPTCGRDRQAQRHTTHKMVNLGNMAKWLVIVILW